MPKFESIFKFSGNLDGAVGMKGANGEVYLRKNVKPADPKTNAQVLTRTKVSLAGQLSKLTPAEAIIGLGGSRRERRNRFMKLIIKKAASGDVTDSTLQARLLPQALVFSEGRDFPVATTVAPALSAVGPGVTVSITEEEKTRIEAQGIKAFVVIFVWSTDNIYKFVDVKNATTQGLKDGVTSLNLNEKANVYIIPVMATENGRGVKYDEGIERIEDEGYSAIADLVAKDVVALGQSNYNGTSNTTPKP